MEKISVMEYLNDNSLLELTYIPYDEKLGIVSHIINGIIKSVGGLNTSLLRRISTEVFIGSITNIDMNKENENKLKGFDYLCYKDELDNLISTIGREYSEFKAILDEYVSDYIRTETNPAVTINAIYDQMKAYANIILEQLSKYIENIDVDELVNSIQPVLTKSGDDNLDEG